MAYPNYHHGLTALPSQPTCWLAASKLPATPPNACADNLRGLRTSPSRLPLPVRRPSLALDCAAGSVEGQHTPALSYTSSTSGGSRSSTLSSAPLQTESSFHWHHSTSPEHVPPHATSISPARVLLRSHGLRHIDAELPNSGELQPERPRSESAAESQEDDPALVHPRIIKASTDRRPGFVEGLVDVSEIAITSIWSSAAAEANVVADDGSVLPLRWFIKETLRRSRTSCSTLQLALFYLHKSRMRIRDRVLASERAKAELARIAASGAYPTPPSSPQDESAPGTDAAYASELLAASRDPLCCGRRMFLASLVCASKFLQDRNYSSRAWSKISGLSVHEINANERALLHAIEYELFVRADLFANWTQRLETLAGEYTRQNGHEARARDEPPPSPVSSSSETAPVQLPQLPRSASEYLAAPEPSSNIHATLPTPILPNEAMASRSFSAMRRSDSERAMRSCRVQDKSAMLGMSRLSHDGSMLNGWLAAQSTSVR